MNIVIENNATSQHANDFNLLYLKAYQKKILIHALLAFVLTTFIFVILIFFVSIFAASLSRESWVTNIYFGLGISCFFAVYLIYSQYFRNKKNFILLLDLSVKTLFQPSNLSKLIFNDEGINYTCDAIKSEMKWQTISAYTIYKNYIVIYKLGSTLQPYYFHTSLVNSNDLDELLNFLKQFKEIPAKKFPFYD